MDPCYNVLKYGEMLLNWGHFCFSCNVLPINFQVEVTSEEPETNTSYEELHVHVSADTYEKVDAAVALIELLITPVSVSSLNINIVNLC